MHAFTAQCDLRTDPPLIRLVHRIEDEAAPAGTSAARASEQMRKTSHEPRRRKSELEGEARAPRKTKAGAEMFLDEGR